MLNNILFTHKLFQSKNVSDRLIMWKYRHC